MEVNDPFFVGEGAAVQFSGLLAEFPPALVAVHHRNAFKLVAVSFGLKLGPVSLDAFHGRLAREREVIAVDTDLAFGL